MAIENIEIGTVTNDGKGERLALAFDVANANFNELETGKENPLTFSSPLVRTVDAVSIPKASSGINGYLSGSDWNTFINKQSAITLTTTGTSGASTLVGSTLNIPQYNGGGGAVGRHALLPLQSGNVTNSVITSVNPLSSTAFIANRLIAYPFIPNQSFTTSNLFINVTTPVAGSLSRIAIYSDLDGYPNSRLFVSADLDCSTLGQKTATTSFSFVAGTTYWLTFHGGAIASTASCILQQQTIAIKANSIQSMANSVFYNLAFTTATPATFLAGQVFISSAVQYIGITKA
jgi:hypothetical protein